MADTAQALAEIFVYDPATGILSNRIARHCVEAGGRAGWLDSSGYRRVSFHGQTGILEHRIIFALMTGEWPTLEIDHINGNPADNRWENLRQVTHRQNMANQGAHKKGKTKGIYWHKDRKVWQARIWDGSRLRYLGLFDRQEDAQAAYNAAGYQLHGEYFRSA